MVKSLAELQRENERLRNQIKAKEEMIKLSRQRNALARENRSLIREMKYGGAYKFGRKAGEVGKKLGKGLLTIAKNIEASQRKEDMLRRKQVKTIKRVATGRKKYTKKSSSRRSSPKRKTVRRSRR